MSSTPPPPQNEASPLADVPEEIREAAKAAPDHWLGLVDPGWHGDSAPPRWTVAGEFRSSLEGEVVEWRDNEDYRPSPEALGWPKPTDPVDEAVQLASTGWGPPEDVPQRLAGSYVGIWLGVDETPLRMRTPDGTPVVPVFTSGEQLQVAGQFGSSTIAVEELAEQLVGDEQLYVNPLSVVAMVIDPKAVLAAAADKAEEGTADAPGAAQQDADEEEMEVTA